MAVPFPDAARHLLRQFPDRFRVCAFLGHLAQDGPVLGSRHRLFGFELCAVVAGSAGFRPLEEPEAGDGGGHFGAHLVALGGEAFVGDA